MTMYLDVLVTTETLTIIQIVKSSNLGMTLVMSMTVLWIAGKQAMDITPPNGDDGPSKPTR